MRSSDSNHFRSVQCLEECSTLQVDSEILKSDISDCRVMAEAEGVVLEPSTLDAIMLASGGDMRKAVTFLQSSHQLSGGAPVTAAMVMDISAQVCEST